MANSMRPRDGTDIQVNQTTLGLLEISYTNIHGETVRIPFTDWNVFDDFVAKLQEKLNKD